MFSRAGFLDGLVPSCRTAVGVYEDVHTFWVCRFASGLYARDSKAWGTFEACCD